jgi:hypothetical protein
MGCGESVSMPSKCEETYSISKNKKNPLTKKGVSVFLQVLILENKLKILY